MKDGGPAFPNTLKITDADFADLRGLTKREWYAGLAMQGLYASCTTVNLKFDNDTLARDAKAAFAIADAMIAEGEKV